MGKSRFMIYMAFICILIQIRNDSKFEWGSFHLTSGGRLFLWNEKHIIVMNLLKRESSIHPYS